MFKNILLFLVFSGLFLNAFSQQKNYTNLIIGKWLQDSIIITNVKSNIKKLNLGNGYTITFEKSGQFLNNMDEITKTLKINPLTNFASAKWKIKNNDTVEINSIYTLTKEYKEKLKTTKTSMKVDNKNIILYLDESILIFETIPAMGAQQKIVSYFKKVK
jgi:hypothetical protein